MKRLLTILMILFLPLFAANNAYADKLLVLNTSLFEDGTLHSTDHEFSSGMYQEIQAISGGRYSKIIYTKPSEDRKYETFYRIKQSHIDDWFKRKIDPNLLGAKGSIKNSIGFVKYQKLKFDGKNCVFLLATRNGPLTVTAAHGIVGGHRKCTWYIKQVIQAHYCDENVLSSVPNEDIKSLIMGMSLVNK